jgi:hypothetical protein
MGDERQPGMADSSEEYNTLLELEDLETLLEELEEQGISELTSGSALPADLQGRIRDLGVRDLQQIRDRIMHLHAALDQDDSDLTITDS